MSHHTNLLLMQLCHPSFDLSTINTFVTLAGICHPRVHAQRDIPEEKPHMPRIDFCLTLLDRSRILVSMNRLTNEKRARVVAALVEGNSIQLTGILGDKMTLEGSIKEVNISRGEALILAN